MRLHSFLLPKRLFLRIAKEREDLFWKLIPDFIQSTVFLTTCNFYFMCKMLWQHRGSVFNSSNILLQFTCVLFIYLPTFYLVIDFTMYIVLVCIYLFHLEKKRKSTYFHATVKHVFHLTWFTYLRNSTLLL